jgi:limonene-1,2-epoxide hydrolase
MTAADNTATVHRLWAALYDRHDFDEVGALFSPDGYYCDMPHPEHGATGPAEVAARLRLGLAKLTDHTHDIERIIAEGDTVVTEHTEHWFFLTGEQVSLPFVSVHRFRGDQIVLWRDYWNWDTLMSAVPAWWLDEIAAGYR